MNQSTFEIIKIGQDKSVDARELHTFLESKQHFADWIKNRIKEYDLIQDIDFIVHKVMNGYNQVVSSDYKLSLDAAKQLCMVERNTKGKQARLYFIEVERRWRETVSKMTPTQILLENCRRLVEIEQEQMAHDRRIGTLEGRVALLASDTEYATVRGMARSSPMKNTCWISRQMATPKSELSLISSLNWRPSNAIKASQGNHVLIIG